MTATVLHVVGSASTDAIGIARFVLDSASALPPGRYRFELLFLGAPGPAAEESRRRGIPAQVATWPHPLHVGGAWRVWRALRGRQVDIVHQHYGGRSVTRWLRMLTAAPVVAHMCGRLQERHWKAGPRTFDMRHFDAVTAVSRSVAQCCSGREATVVYPPIPAAPRPRERDGAPDLLVGAASRLVPLKGIDQLLAAFGRVAPHFPSARLLIAGDGPERRRLQSQAHSLGIADRVRFLGWIDDMTAFYENLDLLVHPSHEEAFGMSVAEAMARGVPAIGTEIGGLAEIIVNGETGFLIPPGSDSLAGALESLLHDGALRARMGKVAWERIRAEFSPARAALALVEVYDRLLESRKATAAQGL